MAELCTRGIAASQTRCKREMQSKAYDHIRHKTIVGTRAEDLKLVLQRGGSATNNYLRRLHNLALDNGWLHHHIGTVLLSLSSCQRGRTTFNIMLVTGAIAPIKSLHHFPVRQ
jgi:hypothetical protein